MTLLQISGCRLEIDSAISACNLVHLGAGAACRSSKAPGLPLNAPDEGTYQEEDRRGGFAHCIEAQCDERQ